MEFRILGPLEVSRDGRPVPVTGRHHPKLLAVLLLESGRVVSVARLIEALWEYDPPATARRQVQNTLASLRRQLAGPGAPAIEATGEGYRIVVPTEVVDAQRFAQLARQGREAHERDELATASRLLGEALDLWRGEALAGLSGRVVEAAVLRLNESRLAALEDRCEVDVALGRHGLVIGELRELLEHHRYRQRVAGLLMTALHHNGRTPEALEVYADLRNRLSTELGLDPDPELARLHGDILRGELTAPQTADTHTATPRPAQLPAGTATFIGRRQHLTTLDELVEAGRTAAVVSAISGLGGAGKTALAVHWAHRVRDRFADGQLYLNLRGYDNGSPVAPADALARFLTALGQPGSAIPTDIDEAGAMYRSLLADRNMLILLDNARDAAQVRPLLPGGSGNFALVTSRDRLTSLAALDDAAPIRLDTLPHDESIELISHVLGTARVGTEPAAADRLARLCGGLPLALHIATADLADDPTRSITDYVTELAGPGRLDRLTVADDPAVAVAHTIELSHGTLSVGARRLFAALGGLPGEDFAESLALHLAEVIDTDGAAVAELESKHLVERHHGDRLRFHDLVREFAGKSPERYLTYEDHDSVRTGYIDWTYDQYRSLPPEEAPNVLAALDTWASHPDSWKLFVAVTSFPTTDLNQRHVRRRGAQMLDHAREHADADGLSMVYGALAGVYRDDGDQHAAIDYATRAVSTSRDAENGDPDGRHRGNLAIYLADVGRFADSVPLLREALAAATRVGNQRDIRACHGSLGNAYRILGRFAEARDHLLAGLNATDPAAARGSDIVTRYQLIELDVDTGRHETAIRQLETIVDDAQPDNHSRIEIVARLLRGDLYRRQRAFSAAEEDLRVAERLIERTGAAGLMTNTRVRLAELLSDQGQNRQALELLDRVEAGLTEHSDLVVVGEFHLAECRILTRIGDFTAAVDAGGRSRRVFASIGYRLLLANALAALADAHAGMGEMGVARGYRGEALDIRTELGVPTSPDDR